MGVWPFYQAQKKSFGVAANLGGTIAIYSWLKLAVDQGAVVFWMKLPAFLPKSTK